MSKKRGKEKKYVDRKTEKLTFLKGEALAAAIERKEVILREAVYGKRCRERLVCSVTGEPTSLEGDPLKEAIAQELIVSRSVYRGRRLVHADTGKKLEPGKNLEEAITRHTHLWQKHFIYFSVL
jgi:hypothetical protein